MVNYQKARVKLTNKQLNKLKSAAKNKTETMLRINKKNSEVDELLHKLFQIRKSLLRTCQQISNSVKLKYL